MKDNPRFLVLAIIGLIMTTTIFLGCTQETNNNTPNTLQNITIKDIMNEPNQYQGKKIMINGTYQGWSSSTTPPVTKSDWIISDGSDEIYVTGKYPDLDPSDDLGKKIRIEGYIELKEDQPYINATEINIMD